MEIVDQDKKDKVTPQIVKIIFAVNRSFYFLVRIPIQGSGCDFSIMKLGRCWGS